jgi:predicted RND superfamily exporter protein
MKMLADSIDRETAAALGAGPDITMSSSGIPLLVHEMLGAIVPTQLKTMAVALVLCTLIVIIVFRSFYFGLAAASVVFISVAMELGALALLGWPLDFMTVMVSSLVIGAGIDFGIHVTHRFMEEWRDGGVDIDEAMRRTVGNVGRALLSAAITTAGAFLILSFSKIDYMQRFGVITALSLVFALLSSLLILPSILSWRAQRIENKRSREI